MCLHRREPMTSLQIQMDQSGDWKLQQQGGGEKFHQKLQFLPKRILQFVFSISVFSLLLWYSYGCSILPHDESINAFFSTFLFSLSSHILERKYMFLLCNAILAFLAKTSLSISDTDDGDGDDGSLQSANAIPASMEEAPSLMMARQQETDIKEQQVLSEEANDHEEQEEDAENIEASSTAKEGEQVGTARDNTEVMAVKKQDDDDEADETMVVAEENEELSNADELNRKFEEFIRKMKEEIRIEAQRQLVAAV